MSKKKPTFFVTKKKEEIPKLNLNIKKEETKEQGSGKLSSRQIKEAFTDLFKKTEDEKKEKEDHEGKKENEESLYDSLLRYLSEDYCINDTSPFFESIDEEDMEKIKSLFNQNKNIINEKSESGWYPIHLACLQNSCQIIDFLLSNGANINQETQKGFILFKILESLLYTWLLNEVIERLFIL
jgi:ankyrin repeat protein